MSKEIQPFPEEGCMTEVTETPTPLYMFETIPQPVEAIRWTGDNDQDVDAFLGARGGRLLSVGVELVFRDEDGVSRAAPVGWWIVCDGHGRLTAMVDRHFRNTYRLVDGQWCEFCGQVFALEDLLICPEDPDGGGDHVYGCGPCVKTADAEVSA